MVPLLKEIKTVYTDTEDSFITIVSFIGENNELVWQGEFDDAELMDQYVEQEREKYL